MRRVTVRAVIANGDKLLCVRQKAYGGKAEREYWCTPGGGIDEKEDIKLALLREIIEETGITPTIGELLYIQQYADENEEQLEFFFHVTNTDDYKNINLSSASHAKEEIAEFGFVDPKVTNVLPKFLQKENVEQHINSKSPTKIFSYL